MKRRALLIFILAVCWLAAAAQPVAALSLYGQSAVAVDGGDGTVLFAQNADESRPPASIVKLMTVLLLFERMESGQAALDDQITISGHAAAVAANAAYSNVPLTAGASYSVASLLTALAVHSACGATVAIAEYLDGSESAFVARMNRRSGELGLNAQFADSTGLSANNRMTARAIGELACEIVRRYPAYLQYSSQLSLSWGGRTYWATNLLLPGALYEYPGADGLKTGTTSRAGACLVATAQRSGVRVIAVTLGCQTTAQRFADGGSLLDYGFDQLLNYPLAYRDVAASAWYFEGVRACTEAGLLAGISPTEFAPGLQVTRAMFVTVLHRLAGGEAGSAPLPFTDVAAGRYYTDAVGWACEHGVVLGFEDNTFRPDEAVTREQMMTMLYAYARYLDPELNPVDPAVLAAFSDELAISGWAREGAAWTVAKGLIGGMGDGTLAPQSTATRAQLATVFSRQLSQ